MDLHPRKNGASRREKWMWRGDIRTQGDSIIQRRHVDICSGSFQIEANKESIMERAITHGGLRSKSRFFSVFGSSCIVQSYSSVTQSKAKILLILEEKKKKKEGPLPTTFQLEFISRRYKKGG